MVEMVEDPLTKIERDHVSLGNTTEERYWIDDPTLEDREAAWQGQYIGPGQITFLTYPGGRVVGTDYDELNRLQSRREDWPTTGALIVDYDCNGIDHSIGANGTAARPL